MLDLADRIAFATGPSGPNKVSARPGRRHPLSQDPAATAPAWTVPVMLTPATHARQEYLYKVCDAVRELSPLSEDEYLKRLEKLVRERDPASRPTVAEGL